jgi:hypothetical protein
MSVDKGDGDGGIFICPRCCVPRHSLAGYTGIVAVFREAGDGTTRSASEVRVSVISGARQGGQGGAGGHTREPTTEALRAVQRAYRDLFSVLDSS